ncbi:MAG TPA: ISKra4 family transposase [Armatimonadota bacterium]|nr:ISKra4 family transposase [Armatimonadota bacterium]
MSTERERKLDELARRYRERLAQEWPEGETDVTGIEEIVRRVERDVLRELTEEMLREQTGKRPGNHVACPECGGSARYRKQTVQKLVTLFGRVKIERAYFHCAACRQGVCPQDQAWGIGPGNTTPGVQDLAAALGAGDAYTHLPSVLRRTRPQVVLDVKTLEQVAQRLGNHLAATPPVGLGRAERAVAVAMDGVMVPQRGGCKEARCGVVYEPDWTAGRSATACAGLRKEYLGTLASRDTLARAVCARVAARRPTAKTVVAALGDGADWIWEGYARYLPHRVEILDFFHVSERLGQIAAAMHPEDEKAARAWQETQEKDLQVLGPGRLLERLAAWSPDRAPAREVRRINLGYFQNQRERMDYPRYLREGWPIGSGAVEGACKHLVSDRFRGTGMRWKSPTAEPLLQLRAVLLTHPDLDLRPYAHAT